MDEILKTLYVKLDSTMQSLSKTAISQVLIKIVYSSDSRILENEIVERFASVISAKKIDRNQIKALLDELVKANELKFQKGKYYISSSKKEKIDKAQAESIDREEAIIKKYFSPTHSEYSVVQEWFRDALMFFFNGYSDEWVSSLCYKNNSISTRIDSVLQTIQKRTEDNKYLDKNDIKSLPEEFRVFISSTDSLVDAILWEYGTSSFSAKLIKKSSEVDKFTLGTFNGARCILDTNILMHIGLESNIYYDSISTLESAFTNLGIEVGILNITKEEYKRTVANKSKDIMNVIQKNSSNMIELFKDIDDQYIQTALSRHCFCIEDFERFFKQIQEPPKHVHTSLKIELYDDDMALENAIEDAQKDEAKQKELNSIYYSYRQKDKHLNALLHDVGLIYGAKYLREEGKYFILSQDTSVNEYARRKPFVNDLPMSMRIETLLNVLALNNTNISTDNYIGLFANLIRQGLQPNKDTFRLEDLSFMIEKNEQIAQLPPEHSRKIVESVHKKRLLGESEEDIVLEMNRQLQHEKWEVVDELDKTRNRLYISDRENDQLKAYNNKLTSALEEVWMKEAETCFEKEHKKLIKASFVKVIIGLLLIGILCYIMPILNMIDTESAVGKYILPCIIDIVLVSAFGYIKIWPQINNHNKSKEIFLRDYIQKKKKEQNIKE